MDPPTSRIGPGIARMVANRLLNRRKMNGKCIIILSLIFLSLECLDAYAQKSIGIVESRHEQGDKSLDFPVEQWVGKEFVFLVLEKYFRDQGYSNFSLRESSIDFGESDTELETLGHLRYDKFVGKTIKVLKFGQDSKTSLLKVITFIEESSGLKIYGHMISDGHIDGIVLSDDLSKAKVRWLGKAIYSKNKFIRTYSQETDEYGDINVRMDEPLKVIDIWPGVSSSMVSSYPENIWIIVETSQKKKGFLSTGFSWTNTDQIFWSNKRPWEKILFEFNPREKYRWTNEIWNLINNSKVRIGMNEEQVKLSWGAPYTINDTVYKDQRSDQWVYEDRAYLYFENGLLTAIQSY